MDVCEVTNAGLAIKNEKVAQVTTYITYLDLWENSIIYLDFWLQFIIWIIVDKMYR